MSSKVLAGVALDTHAGMLNVYLANTSSGVRATAMAAVPLADRSLIRIHHVPLPESALNATMASTGTVVDRLVSAKIPVQSYYADFESGKVVVTLLRATAAQRSLAARAMRSLPVRIATTRTAIASIKPVTARATSPTVAAKGHGNRAFGHSPWLGGSFIDSTYGGFFHFCTDSWPIKIGTKNYLTTAGHCSPAGHQWINMTLNKNKQPLGDKKRIGGKAVRNELKTKHHLDVQLLPAANLSLVWSGHVLNNYATKVHSHLIPPVGTHVCQDGAYEGTICGAKVTRADHGACIVSSDGKMCHLYRASRPKGKVLIGQGDSGGPDYVAIGKTSHVSAAKGVGLNSLETVANLKCPAFTWRGKVCSNTMFFTSLNAILKFYHAKLRTRS
jgi:hypothetical protein